MIVQIKQASDALATQLGTAVPKSKGFQSAGTKKLAVDVPVADQSAPAVCNMPIVFLQFCCKAVGLRVIKPSTSHLLHVWLHICNVTPVQVAQLVADFLQGLPNGIVDKLTVVFADEDAAQAAKKFQQHAKRRYKAIYLGDAFLDGISGMLLLVGPTKDQVISTAAAILAASTFALM